MRPRIRKFVSREFIKTVDLDLLRMFLEPFAEQIGFSWSDLPGDDRMKRESLYWLFAGADERFPPEFHTALFNGMMLSTPSGAGLLQDLAEEMNVELVPEVDLVGRRDGRHVNPRYLALRTYLLHRSVFERGLRVVAFRAYSAPLELQGSSPDTSSAHEDHRAIEALRAAISAYFVKRYQGRYCDVQFYAEADAIRVLVLHGTKPETKNVERHGDEESITIREITQDTIHYERSTGYLSVGAKSKKDARTLVTLFADHLIGDAEFFSDPGAGLLYSLEPLRRRGRDFDFNFEWDEEVRDVRIREIKIDAGRDDGKSRPRYSPWSMTVSDSGDALRRLTQVAPDIDLSDHRICHIKLEFDLWIDGREDKLVVKIAPPRTAAFRDHAHEQKIWEHLERNGIRRSLRTVPTSLAAE